MTQHLDARQRAMLLEMGIALPVLPARPSKTAPPPTAAAVAIGPAPAPSPLPRETPTRTPPPPTEAPCAAPRDEAAAPPPGALAGVLLASPVAPYASQAPADDGAGQEGGWLVVLECAQPAEPLAGDDGRLLDNMLRAMGLHRQPSTQVAALAQPAPGPAGAPPVSLSTLLSTLRPAMVLVLGLGAARAVLGSRKPLAQLRAQVHHLPDGTPVAVSHEPSYLLHAPEAKAAAWLDLCRALDFVRPGAPAVPPP